MQYESLFKRNSRYLQGSTILTENTSNASNTLASENFSHNPKIQQFRIYHHNIFPPITTRTLLSSATTAQDQPQITIPTNLTNIDT